MARRNGNFAKKSMTQLLALQEKTGKKFAALQDEMEGLRRIGRSIHEEIQARSGGSDRWWEMSTEVKPYRNGAMVKGKGWKRGRPAGTRGNSVPARIVRFLQDSKGPKGISDIMTAVKPSSKAALAVALANLKKKKLVSSPQRGMYAQA